MGLLDKLKGKGQPEDPAHLPGAGAAIALTSDNPHDESEPGFAPIEGIGLEKYADLAVGMQGMDDDGCVPSPSPTA